MNAQVRKELAGWRDFMSLQVDLWEKAGATHFLCNDPEIFAESMIAEAQLQEKTVEAAIEKFIASDRWPDWSPTSDSEAIVYLSHRLVNARLALDHLLAGNVLYPEKGGPNLQDREQALRWLLITMWNACGPEYLQNWADDYIQKNPPYPV